MAAASSRGDEDSEDSHSCCGAAGKAAGAIEAARSTAGKPRGNLFGDVARSAVSSPLAEKSRGPPLVLVISSSSSEEDGEIQVFEASSKSRRPARLGNQQYFMYDNACVRRECWNISLLALVGAGLEVAGVVDLIPGHLQVHLLSSPLLKTRRQRECPPQGTITTTIVPTTTETQGEGLITVTVACLTAAG